MGRKLRQAVRRGDGQTLLMFVLFIFVLFVFVGLGIDLGFAYITQARLSKAVDAACLEGIRNISQGQTAAGDVARSTFFANYGTSGRDKAPPTVNINFSTDANNNTLLDVNATVAINTFFIRALPLWKTLGVGSSAQATRNRVVMSLVLDRSGSMNGNGGAAALPPAVGNFINFFDDVNDQAAMVSFASAASTDVTMQHPFKTAISNAAAALNFNTYTCSERGLTNGLAQNNTVTIPAGQKTIKVIVFFTDGMANTWYYPSFDCGPRNISYQGPTLWDPATGNQANNGCTVPSTLPAIDPKTGVLTPNAVSTSSCDDLHYEAQRRAERIAYLARAGSNIVYSVGLGKAGGLGECGDGVFPVLNPVFLKNVANTSDSATYDPSQPSGDYAIAANSGQLNQAFQTIASKILLRISK